MKKLLLTTVLVFGGTVAHAETNALEACEYRKITNSNAL